MNLIFKRCEWIPELKCAKLTRPNSHDESLIHEQQINGHYKPMLDDLPQSSPLDHLDTSDQNTPQRQSQLKSSLKRSGTSTTCTKCGEQFRGRSALSNLRRHKKEQHSDGNNRPYCSICGKGYSRHKYRVQHHKCQPDSLPYVESTTLSET